MKKILLLSFMLLGIWSLNTYAQYSKYAMDDAVVYEALPTQTATDVHASNIFIANTTGDDEVIALVKFDVSGLMGRKILSAEFSTRSDMTDDSTMTVKLTGAGLGFSRDTTAWENKPSIAGKELATALLDMDSGRKIYVETGSELVNYINSKLMAGDTAIAFAIQYKSGAGGDFKWMAGKGDGSWAPLLEMELENGYSYYPSADGTIYEALPDQAVADVHASNIFIGNTTGDDEVIALIQFDLSGLAYRQIGMAGVSTRSDMNDGKTMTVKLTPAGDNFDRTTTWTTKPSTPGTELATVLLDQDSGRKPFVETGSALIDYINGKLATGNEIISFAIQYKEGDGGDFKWMAGKGDGSWAPILEIGDVTPLPAALSAFPTGDATIYEAMQDQVVTDVHASNIFIANTNGEDEVIALVKFDISAFANRTVSSVMFSTRSDMNDDKTMTVKLTEAGAGFSRDTTSWSNKPSIKSKELATVILDMESNRKYYVETGSELTNYVNAKLLAGADEIAFAIQYKEGDGGDLKWMAGKGDGSWAPMLELEFGDESSYYGTKDGTIYKALPDQAVADVHASNIFIAKTNDDDEVIALVQFELSGLAYTSIEDVKFSTRSDMNDDKTMTVKVTAAGNDFDRSTTWNTKPTTSGTELATVIMDMESNRKEYTQSGTAFVDYINGILAGGSETVSIALRYKDGDGGDLKWCGGVGDGSFGPMLEIVSTSLVPDGDTLVTIADTYVDQTDPDANFGTAADMHISKDAAGSSSKEVLLKFNISELPDAIVGKATLRLYIAQHSSGTQVDNFYADVFAVEDQTWLENAVTWNTKPAAGMKLIEENVTWFNEGKDTTWTSADLTHYLNDALAMGMDSVSFVIKGKNDTPGNRLWTAGKEWKNEARLVIDYTVEPPERNVPVVADAHVEQGAPDANFGGENDMHLINDDANNLSKWVYLKFDVSKAYPNVISATLNIYGAVHNSAADISSFRMGVYGVTDIAWDENALTWNTRPAVQNNMFFEATLQKTGKYYNLSSSSFTDYINAAINQGLDSVTIAVKGLDATPGNRAWISGMGYRPASITLNYEQQVVQPRFNPAPAEYFASVDVQLSTLTSGATIYYTLDGSDPDETSTEYTAAITLTDTTTVKAIAYATDLKPSPLAIGTFIVTPVSPPTFEPSPVPKYQPPLEVSITAVPEGSVIRYSDDGGAPTTLYTGPIVLNQTTTLKAQAYNADFTFATEIVEVTYTIVPPTGTAGTGPGGVGFRDLSRTGQPEVSLWLKPESITGVADGGSVTEWPDASGNGNDGYNTWTDGGDNGIDNSIESQKQPPVFMENALNGMPVLNFGEATGDRTRGTILVDDADNLDGGEGISIFMVIKRNELLGDFAAFMQKRNLSGSDPTKQAYVLEMNGGSNPNEMQWVIARDIFARNDSVIDDQRYYLFNVGLNGTEGLAYFITNGFVDATVAYDKTIQATETPVLIGGFQAMNIAEVIAYNSTVNVAQTLIVHEYLAAKYGLNLTDGTGSTNMFTNPDYSYDLIGVGKAANITGEGEDEHLHSTAGALELLASGFGAEGDFIFAGHNGMPTTEGGNKVWDRMWYVQTAGTGGDVDMIFDFEKAGLTLTSANGYVLGYRDTEDGTWTDLGITPVKDGNKLVFTVTGIQDGYYAVGQGLPVGIDNLNADENNAFSVYPNPSSGMITVAFSNDKGSDVSIHIYDLSGRLARSVSDTKSVHSFSRDLDIRDLEQGIYTIEVRQGEHKMYQRLVVK